MSLRAIGEEHHMFRTRLERWGVPAQVVDGLMSYHSPLSYTPGSLVFRQGSPADIMFWVVRGVVKVYCPQPEKSRILVRLVGSGDIVGEVDALDERGQWVRLFEAQALTRCTLAMVTRQHLVRLFEGVSPTALVEMGQRINAAWASWVSYYANFLGLSFRQRLEVVLKDLGARFGVREKEGMLLTFEPVHADLAEMIGSSRPMVSRLMADLLAERAIARRGKQYILLSGGCLMEEPSNGKVGGESLAVRNNLPKRDSAALRAAASAVSGTLNDRAG